jgi:hypothetical protein
MAPCLPTAAWSRHAKITRLKLVPCWFVGQRDAGWAYHFMYGLKARLVSRVQLTTDGHKPYFVAVEGAFGCEVGSGNLRSRLQH